ncbi:MAG: hypothetical protein IT349_04110 [Candidatus Eisenbacteria bacterium]|nr:hypothetical protein [Candidatus Eisenbacteria bacterium]MCC7141264.1 hypothetical protein [Candidatus Eisenbacteria bacterium]
MLQSPPGPRPDRPERGWDRIAIGILVAYAGYYVYLALGLPIARVVNGLLDDSFYYLQVARAIAEGRGSTFDGVEPTNGYHPLWMAILVPVQWIARGDGDLAVRLALLLSGGLAVASLALLRSLLRPRIGSWGVVVAFLLWSWPRFFGFSQNLLESSLVLFLLLLWVRIWLGAPTGRRTLGLGVLGAAIALARLDTVFFLAAWGMHALGLAFRRGGPRPLRLAALRSDLAPLFLTAALIAPYLFWNLSHYGHLQPISGAMKSSFPVPHPTWRYLWEFPDFSVLFGLALAASVALFRSETPPLLRAAGVLGAAALLQLAYAVFFMVWGVDRWHFVLLAPLGLLVLPWVAAWGARRYLPSSPTRAVVVVAGLWLAVAVQTTSLKLRDGRWLAHTRDLALWAEETLEPDAVVAMTDAGVFAYWSGRTTINLDGLINNYRYRDLLRAGRLTDYLAERGVDYVLDQNHIGSPAYISGRYDVRPFRIWYRPENRVAGEVKLFRDDEVRRVLVRVRTQLGSLRTEPNAIILWRYRPERQETHS